MRNRLDPVMIAASLSHYSCIENCAVTMLVKACDEVDGKDPFDKQCRLEPSFRPVATASNIVVFSSSRGFMKPKTSRVLGRSENQCRPKSVVEVPWFPDTARCLPTHACPVLLLWSQAGT